MKYLLIDGNNLSVRCAFANETLRSTTGIPTGVHFGVMQSLIKFKEDYPDYQILISWDGKSQRRVKEAQAAVEKNLIPSGYKENRPKGEDLPQAMKDFHAQSPYLKRAVECTGIPQIRLEAYETDDIINTYCNLLKKDNEVVCVTGDEDYFQLLDDHVVIFNAGKKKTTTKTDWEKENGIKVGQYLDVCALMGDTSDNIFGVYGIGPKTALDLIKEHGSCEKVMEAFHKELDPLRQSYPDIEGEDFKTLAEMGLDDNNPKKKAKYPSITPKTPFTGVAWALENKKVKKLAKTTLMTLMFEEVVKLGYSLSKMDIITDLPEIKQGEFNKAKLLEYLDYYDIQSLKGSVDIFRK